MKRYFCLIVSLIVLFGCQKETNIIETNLWDRQIIDEIKENVNNYPIFIENAYEMYSMEVYCACDCGSVSALIDAINSNLSLFGLPDSLAFTCAELLPVGFACAEDIASKRPVLFNEIDSITNLNIITLDEADLLKDLFDDIYSNPFTINFNSYITIYEQIDFSGTITNGIFSFGIINGAKSVHEYFNDPNILPETGDEAFLIHKAIGAFGGAWFAGVKYLYDNRDCLECTQGRGFAYDMAWGAVGGAVMAL